jgi:hypothetical protein
MSISLWRTCGSRWRRRSTWSFTWCGSPTTLGAGTEDAIIVANSTEVILWEQPGSPVFLRFDDVGSGTLTIRLVVFGYSAFTAGRQPTATAKVIGTGLQHRRSRTRGAL